MNIGRNTNPMAEVTEPVPEKIVELGDIRWRYGIRSVNKSNNRKMAANDK